MKTRVLRSGATRVALVMGALVMGALLCAPAAWAFGVPEVMALLAQRKSGEARFTEQRFVAGLEQPLVATGTLSFTAPDQLSRRTTSPKAEAMLVDGNRLTLERGGRVHRMRLDTMPEIAGMVAAMRGTLTGNVAALREFFDPSVDGSAARWTLTLTPTDERLQGVLRSLRLEGQRAELRVVEVLLADGDRSRMTIETLPPAKP